MLPTSKIVTEKSPNFSSFTNNKEPCINQTVQKKGLGTHATEILAHKRFQRASKFIQNHTQHFLRACDKLYFIGQRIEGLQADTTLVLLLTLNAPPSKSCVATVASSSAPPFLVGRSSSRDQHLRTFGIYVLSITDEDVHALYIRYVSFRVTQHYSLRPVFQLHPLFIFCPYACNYFCRICRILFRFL